MNWYFDNDRPIYKQLVEQLKIFILNGSYKMGEKLPSVRDLAFETKVNPNTMQRALQELEELGLIYTERTNGKFVTDNNKLLLSLREEYVKDKVDVYYTEMNRLGLTKEEATDYFEKYRREEK